MLTLEIRQQTDVSFAQASTTTTTTTSASAYNGQNSHASRAKWRRTFLYPYVNHAPRRPHREVGRTTGKPTPPNPTVTNDKHAPATNDELLLQRKHDLSSLKGRSDWDETTPTCTPTPTSHVGYHRFDGFFHRYRESRGKNTKNRTTNKVSKYPNAAHRSYPFIYTNCTTTRGLSYAMPRSHGLFGGRRPATYVRQDVRPNRNDDRPLPYWRTVRLYAFTHSLPQASRQEPCGLAGKR